MTHLRSTLFLAVAMLASGAAFAQKGGDTAEIEAAEKAWAKAVSRGDATAMGNVLSSDLVYTHSTGNVDTKDSYIKSITSGVQKYAGVEHSDMVVKRYGNAAFVATKVRMHGSTKGVPFDNQLRMLHMWVKQQGRWQLVAHQTSRLP